MGGRKKRRVATKGNQGSACSAAESTARWGELPREIVAMIASYTCTPVQALPFKCLTHTVDPDSCAYHRQEDRSFIGPSAQFFCGQGSALQDPGSTGQPGGSSSSSAGPSTSTAPPPDTPAGTNVGGSTAELDPGDGSGAIPGIFRPSRMSDTALAMRCVCRQWCEVLSEGVRRVLLLGPDNFTLWASHFPQLTHLALGYCTDVMVRQAPDERLAPGAAGPGPSSAAAAAAAAASRRRSPRTTVASPRAGSARRSSGGGGGGARSGAPAPEKTRSLAALTSLRNLQITDTAVHLDLASTCPWLDELVVWGLGGLPHQQYGTYPGRDTASYFGQALNLHVSGARARASAGRGAANAVTRRSALDSALSHQPQLRRLRLSGVDASAARLGAALMGLTALTSLRMFQCKLPSFIGEGERVRPGHSSFGRKMILNLGARLQDLSLQGCCIRVLPEGVLSGLSELRLLDLSSNCLHALPHTVTELQRLEYLDVQHNTLMSLPNGLAALSRLVDLDVSGNNLHRLPADFGGLTALTHLHLGGLHGLDIALCWPQLAALTSLHSLGLCDVDLSDDAPNGPPVDAANGARPVSPLQALVAALAPAGRLRELMLDGCGLDYLPPCLSELTALSHLSLMENFDASSLPAATTTLRSLAVLRAGYLDLHMPLPAGLFEMTTLRELNLEQNFLPYISPSISKLSNLQVLNLMDALDMEGPAHAVPWPSIYRLSRLSQLAISGTEYIREVAAGIGALTALEVLQLHSVPVPFAVLEEVCSELVALTCLDLHSCGITSLPATITQLQRLTELQLLHNHLSRLPAGLGALTRLLDLALRGNSGLRVLPAEMTRLTRLHCLSWDVGPNTPAPSAELLAWMARLPDLALLGSHHFAEVAKSYDIPWPKRTSYW